MIQKILLYFDHFNFHRKNKSKKHIFDLLKFSTNKEILSDKYILTQIVYDYNYVLKLASFTQSYANIKKYKIIAYDTYYSWNPFVKFLDLFFSNGFRFFHSSFTNEIISSIYSYKKCDKKRIKKHFIEILNEIKEPKDILNIKFNDIEVGDLIYDTYLRFYKKPTINFINRDLKKVIFKALNIYYNFNDLFIEKDIKIFVTSLTTYIHHGIPTRMCLNKNIPVYALSSNNYIVQKIENHFPYHSIDYTKFYHKEITDTKYDVKQLFESRFNGVIDKAISYMRKSSYSLEDNSLILEKHFSENNRNVVIYIHDFYDSPHINRNLYYNDLYDFLDSVIKNLTNTDTNFYIKPHPNSVYNSDQILENLINRYNKPNVHLLSNLISNNDIIKLRPDLVVTARGTISIEMAYMDIPVVALYDNPYVNFDFIHTCYSLQEYYDIINGLILPKVDFNKSKILSFYYQYFLENTLDDQYNIFSNTFDNRLLSNENVFNNEHVKNSIIKEVFENSKSFISDYIIINEL